MAGDFFELFKNACNFFCGNGKITSIYHILEKLGEFNISAQNDVDFPPISLKFDNILLIVY
jgi:hypothetical protein